jgi:hypothetical protein
MVALERARGCPAWVQASGGAIGYYRVEYQGGVARGADGPRRGRAPDQRGVYESDGNAQALSAAGKFPAAEAKADPAVHLSSETCRSSESGVVADFKGCFLTQDECAPIR